MNTKQHNMQKSGQRAGFTLMEIMLSLGVLGIGMVMVATLFPPAVMQAKKANENTLSIVVSENARTMLETRIRFLHEQLGAQHNLLDYSGTLTFPNDYEFEEVPLARGDDDTLGYTNGDIVHMQDTWYNGSRNNVGWRALVRRVPDHDNWPPDPKLNTYQFIVLPYVLPPTATLGESAVTWDNQGSDYDELRPLVHVFRDSASRHGTSSINADNNVRIFYSEFDGFLMLVDKDGKDEKDFPWLAIGSPVVLDGGYIADEKYLGRCPRIVDISDWEEDPDYWACRLSGEIFDRNHDDWGSVTNVGNPGISRGVWVFRPYAKDTTENDFMFGSQSPAIGTYGFTSIIN